jgi:hypothetical protein
MDRLAAVPILENYWPGAAVYGPILSNYARQSKPAQHVRRIGDDALLRAKRREIYVLLVKLTMA